MALNNSKFPFRRIENQMKRVAEYVTYIPTTLCPCAQDGNVNEADPTHVLCHGTGHLPLLEKEQILFAVVSHQIGRESLFEGGLIVPGSIYVSQLPRDPVQIGEWDIIRLQNWENGEPYQGDIVTIPQAAPFHNALTFTPLKIDYALSLVGEDKGTVVYYTPDVDFTINGYVIDWVNPPAPGTQVSFKYQAIMDYIVKDPPDVRYERGTDIGSRITCIRRDVFLASQSAGGSDTVIR